MGCFDWLMTDVATHDALSGNAPSGKRLLLIIMIINLHYNKNACKKLNTSILSWFSKYFFYYISYKRKRQY